MPRTARVVCVGVPYHVTQRGNFRMNIFEEELDREKYLEYFEMYKTQFGVKVYAWCLMSNHVHFIVEPTTEQGLAALFKFTHMRYSQYFNKKKGSPGHLWQGRFYSTALDDAHFYEAVRYVELNPLRAKLVRKLENYRWCSSYDRLNGETTLPLAEVKKYMEVDNWRDYLLEPLDEDMIQSIRKNSGTGRPTGSETFVKKMERKTGRSFALKKPGRPKRKQ